MFATAARGRRSRVGGRLAAVDALRGLAVLAMVIFHAGWDVAWVGLLSSASRDVPGWWQVFGDGVAAAFLLISGLSLVLARRRGSTAGRSLRRIGVVLAAALAVTALSWLVVPRMTIVMGILHCIVVGDLIGLAVLEAPTIVVAAVALLFLLLPLLPLPAALDAPAWAWLGLGSHVPDTLDYRPICPWAGVVLMGVLLGRLCPEEIGSRWPTPPSLLTLAGRHSLAIYLAHQAVLFPLIAGIAVLCGAHVDDTPAAAWSARFEARCIADCGTSGAGPALCTSVCRCVETRMRPLSPWAANGPSRQVFAEAAQACFADAGR